jgi:hypothetical protein
MKSNVGTQKKRGSVTKDVVTTSSPDGNFEFYDFRANKRFMLQPKGKRITPGKKYAIVAMNEDQRLQKIISKSTFDLLDLPMID